METFSTRLGYAGCSSVPRRLCEACQQLVTERNHQRDLLQMDGLMHGGLESE